MSQDPINIMGVCAFPNENGVRDIRFVDCYYNTLFFLPNHTNIMIGKPDGTQLTRQCSYIDDYHVRIGLSSYHIMEFAELAWRNGYAYLPEHPREQDCCDTYALYQLKDITQADYFCSTYESAKGRIRPADYRCVYRSNLAPSVTLEDIRKKHSIDLRPRNEKLRALWDSDILIVNQDGKQTAYYVEAEKFAELPPGFTEKLLRQSNDERGKPKHEPER